jgi:NAD(P)-dependent dehydrogenase (short-subunit alcohol dehydrogenase family)
MAAVSNYIDLSGKTAIVTGGGSGIGRGIALRLAASNASIAVADINAEAAAAVVDELTALGVKAAAIEADVTDQGSTDAMASTAIDKLGRIDILVNNAGVAGAPGWADRNAASVEDWTAVFEVNVLGIVHSTRSVSGHMKERRSGRIVNISSGAGRRGSPGFAHYSTSKASAINVSQAFAHELAPFRINVNTVCPGMLWTELWHGISKRQLNIAGDKRMDGRQYFEDRQANVPLRRELVPGDIGNAVAFLASDRAKSITGQALNVDGGVMMN